MDLSFSEEQSLLRDSVDRFLRDHYSHEQRRALAACAAGYSPDHWQSFAELGWLALPFSEADGGLGGSAVDMMVLMEGLGAGAILEPYLATVILAGGVLRHGAADDLRSTVLPALIEGQEIWALAHWEPQARFDLLHVACRARELDGTPVLTGEKTVVLHGPNADHLIVSAATADGVVLYWVAPDAAGLGMQAYRTVDGLPACDLTLTDTPARAVIVPPADATAVLAQMADDAIAALCAEAVGAMQRLLDMTTAYTKDRVQFGQPIAKFQALRHRMAEMAIAVEEARSMALYLALTLDQPDSAGVSRQKAAAAAKAKIGDAARFVGQNAIQLHGAMGVTEEMPIGDLFRRLMLFETLFGNTDYQRRRYAALAA